jgi:hypothetical protein
MHYFQLFRFLPMHYFQLFRSRNIETWLVVHACTQAELEKLFPNKGDRLHFNYVGGYGK